MNMEHRSRFCSMHFFWTCLTKKSMSTMLHSGHNPHWPSGRLASDTMMIQFSMTWKRSFLAMERSEIALVVSTVGFTAFIFVEGYNQGISEIFWHLLLFPDVTKDIMEDINCFWACSFVQLSKDSIFFWCSVKVHLVDGFHDFNDWLQMIQHIWSGLLRDMIKCSGADWWRSVQ